MLKFARQHGCPWDEGTCECRRFGRSLEVGSDARLRVGRAHVVNPPLRVGPGRCYSGRGSTAARGKSAGAKTVPATTLRFWHGCGSSPSRSSLSYV